MTLPDDQRAVRLAEQHFGDNLAAAFVGGSYARGTAKPTSDIDVFVLLKQCDQPSETAFANALRALHEEAGLHFDHCGEIFDTASLGMLLSFTEQALAAMPAIQRSACYQADCPLSVFRKGDIVFKFLDDPKLHTLDPGHVLPALEKRAAAYFAKWPMPRVQEHKKALALPEGSEQASLARTWAQRQTTPQWIDTPTGVGLERWFGADLTTRAGALAAEAVIDTPSPSPSVCPIPLTNGAVRRVFAAQCLARSTPLEAIS
ncbi:nucleotidyltransferase domain-containing protein [Streptomyces sp. NPDC058653]|uniref:nucleotidyltransferase domain-containing protein n=1 Tax=Streptomyces sp. NPDC058653 TaxID=3346576 RepID=UPI00365EDC2D